MDLDPNSDGSIWGFKPDDLLVKLVGQLFGLTASVILAAFFFWLAWRDGALAAVRAGGLLSLFAQSVRRRLGELSTAQVVLAVAATVIVVFFEALWLFCVFTVGNLVSLAFGQRDERILRLDLLDPLGTFGVLQWDIVSAIYVLMAVGTLAISRWHYRREYGSEFLGFVVAAPALLVGVLAALGVALLLVLVGLAWLFEGSTELDAVFWSWLLIAGGAAAYVGLCVLALRAAVFVGNLWLGDVHDRGRHPLMGEPPVSAQASAYFREFYRAAKGDSNRELKRLNWRTRGWEVSQTTTSDDRSSRTEYLYMTTSGRPVYVGHHGGIERVNGHLHKFPVNWGLAPRQVTRAGVPDDRGDPSAI